MEDGNLAILYTKETRPHLHSALYTTEQQSNRAAEQQSSRATEQQISRAFCRSRDPCSVVSCLLAWSRLQIPRASGVLCLGLHYIAL
jgi:hypothetical protein